MVHTTVHRALLYYGPETLALRKLLWFAVYAALSNTMT